MSDLYDDDSEAGYEDDYLASEDDDVDEDALDTLAQEFPELDEGGSDELSESDE
jgi:hypothetical protein